MPSWRRNHADVPSTKPLLFALRPSHLFSVWTQASILVEETALQFAGRLHAAQPPAPSPMNPSAQLSAQHDEEGGDEALPTDTLHVASAAPRLNG